MSSESTCVGENGHTAEGAEIRMSLNCAPFIGYRTGQSPNRTISENVGYQEHLNSRKKKAKRYHMFNIWEIEL